MKYNEFTVNLMCKTVKQKVQREVSDCVVDSVYSSVIARFSQKLSKFKYDVRCFQSKQYKFTVVEHSQHEENMHSNAFAQAISKIFLKSWL